MHLDLLTASQKWLVAGSALALAVTAALLHRRFGRSRAAAAVATVVAAACLVIFLDWALGLLSREVGAEFNEYRWVSTAPWDHAGVVLGLLAVAGVIALSWHSSRRLSSPWHRAFLLGLRAAAATSAYLLFLQPAIELRQVTREPNRIAIVIDESQSMSLREDPGSASRQQRARALIERSSSTLESWRKDHFIDFYAFSDSLTLSSEKSVATRDPAGRATLMRLALEQIQARYRGEDLAGVILISDGIATGGFSGREADGAAAAFLESLPTPVHTIWVGRPGLRDVSIARVLADEFAFARTVVRVEAIVRVTGYGATRLPLVLLHDGQPIRQAWVTTSPENRDARAVFEFSPQRVGQYVYEIETPVGEDEAVKTNNRRAFVLRVIRDKIRVLQVAGQPSWDVRALRQLLKQDPNVDLISFFILRTPEDISMVPNYEMSLIPFPTRELFEEQLASFDLVVLQNFEYLPYGIGAYLENIRRYVQEGGGLAMIGGPLSFASGGYSGSPLADALPVHLPAVALPREKLHDVAMFSPLLTRPGKIHPITALRYHDHSNVITWETLPALEGVNIVGDARPGAAALAVHPVLRTPSGKRMPVITAGDYGHGRSLAVTTDSLWRWGFVAADNPENDGRYYHKYWSNAIRWLIHDPDLELLHASSDAAEYRPQSLVRLEIRALNRNYSPHSGPVTLRLSRGSDPERAELLEQKVVKTDEGGRAQVDLPGLAQGVYRVHANAVIGGRDASASDIFLVSEGSAELDQPEATDGVLRLIARSTGGRFVAEPAELPADFPFAAPRISRVDQRRRVELWSRPGLLVLALLFLAMEWILRQRMGSL